MPSPLRSSLEPAPRQIRLTPGRLEAFSDGVIAVIITIMVLELKVPHSNGLAGLREIVPTLPVYLLSFSFVSIYWVNHHLLVSRIEEVDPRTLYTNLLFLFSLSLLPFATTWLVEKDHTGFAARLYTSLLIATGFTYLLLRLSVQRRLRISGSLNSADLTQQRKHILSLSLYVLAIALSFRSPIAALVLDAAVTLVWIVPELGTGLPNARSSRDTTR